MPKKNTKQTTLQTKGRKHAVAKSMPPRRAKAERAVMAPEDLDAQRARNEVAAAQKPTAARPAQTEAAQPKEDLVVFAIRLTKAERDAIHAAAGPGKATKFVRSLAVAAARGDGPTVLGILDTIQK